ncbi:MAG TPA: rRNA maturation RNase YbeY [Chthoniobacterales bacterium]|nr:rRNA maturation RNase YbeY [Chthoniobacterales bacterium]
MKAATLPPISVSNRQRKIAVDCAGLQDFAQRALPLCARERGTGLTSLSQVDVLLISDRRIAQLHQQFMKIASPTDVITFQHGEIFISVETARRQAKEQGTSLGHELRLYLVHGLLHLQGFDDHKAPARSRMAAVQEKILQALTGKSKQPPDFRY